MFFTTYAFVVAHDGSVMRGAAFRADRTPAVSAYDFVSKQIDLFDAAGAELVFLGNFTHFSKSSVGIICGYMLS